MAILCVFLGMVTVSNPLQRLSDLQIVDKKVTLNHLVCFVFAFGVLLLQIFRR